MMNYVNIRGKWQNEFGSVLQVTEVDPESGLFSALYTSHTGATGNYRVTGLTDAQPEQGGAANFTQTIAFVVSWRDLGGTPTGAHWMSAFSGQIQMQDGRPVMKTTYLLQKDTVPADDWEATAVATATFSPMAEMPQDQGSARVVFALRRGKPSNNGATPWTSTVGIGSPPQQQRMMLDSGTVNTWVTSVQCDTEACRAHQRFDPHCSSTYQVLDSQPQKRDFGPWGTMMIVTGQDKFHLKQFDGEDAAPRVIAQSMPFEAAIDYTGPQFRQLDCDGGIAIPSPGAAAGGSTVSPMQSLFLDGNISYPLAAFWTDAASGVGECVFGAVDPDKYLADTLQWLPLRAAGGGLDYLWSVDFGAFCVDGRAVEAGIARFVLDSGSSFFKGPASLINKLVAAVTDDSRLPVSVSSAAALNAYPIISISLGTQSYVLKPEQYFFQLDETCWQLGIEVLKGMPDGMLLVGSMFMDLHYCIFDSWAARLGIARRFSVNARHM